MYLEHFGLQEFPFSLTPDTSFFFACANYQEALNTLLVAARSGEGFIKIVGEVGNGKTLLCRKFLLTLNNDKSATTAIGTQDATVEDEKSGTKFITAYIPNPYLEPRSLLLALAGEFRIEFEGSVDQHQVLKELTQKLLSYAHEGKRVLVCLDEAQAMPLESMEVLRLLTNLETEKRKLMQVVLFGQPELNERLKHHSVRQLRQRISFQYDLKGLKKDELERYLRHRLQIAGYQGDTLFNNSAVTLLHRVSRGTPRLVNIMAHKALLLAFGQGKQQVTASHIRSAVADTPEASKDWMIWVWSAVGVTVIFLLAFFAVWFR